MNSSSKLSSRANGDGNESSLEQSSEASAVSVSSSRVASAALDLLNLLRDSTQQDIEAQILSILLIVAKRQSDPPNILELAKLANVGEATASRAVATLGRGLRGKPGAGLLETKEDPANYSRKLVHLSAKGERLMKNMGVTLVGSVSKWG